MRRWGRSGERPRKRLKNQLVIRTFHGASLLL